MQTNLFIFNQFVSTLITYEKEKQYALIILYNSDPDVKIVQQV